MQRYGIELADRLSADLDVIRPAQSLRGASGHLWEQLYLPAACGRRLLWSPNNTGPLAITRQVCTIHDLIPLDHPEWFTPRFSGWYRWLMPKLARRAQHFIAVSQFTKRRMMEKLGVSGERITVVPNGVDSEFKPSPPDRIEAVRKRLGIKAPNYLLSLGSLEPRKNLGRLLKAWEQLAPELPEEIELVIAGAQGASLVFAGVKFDRLPPRVHFTGYIDQKELPTLYSGALAFVYPSLYEGFGLPPLEAMACGTPVVTSIGSSLSEVVGDAAVVIDPECADSISEGMRSIVADSALRSRLIQAGRDRAAHMTWNRTAQMTRQVLVEQAQS